MRLKTIKLAGFKSFVDPTSVNFPSNMVGVVGPNGCGKSNIIDAVRWVMGESSAKNLRGESMADVIFNGSVNRQPVGQASIELVFDNTDRKLGGEYAAYNEIAIKRRVTRDGQSDYFLNGSKCRRRDITDIFLGTGLGPRSYAIIEQGMISKLVEAKPEELRVFIEEAAGISKYKERRRETESRMKRTRENLERLTDLRDELGRQLQHLQRQASAAEKYKEFKKEERLTRAELQGLQWKGLNAQVKQREVVIRDLEVNREAVIAEQRACDAAIERYREQHSQLNETFNDIQGKFYAAGAEIARTEQTITHTEDRIRQLDEDLSRAEAGLGEADKYLTGDAEKVLSWGDELELLGPELELAESKAEQSGELLEAAELAMQDWQAKWEDFNNTASEARRTAEVEQSKIQQFEIGLDRLKSRVERGEEELSKLSISEAEQEIEVLSEQLAELQLQEQADQEQLQSMSDQLTTLRDQINEKDTERNAVRSELQQLRGRRASLEALQQAALAQDSDELNRWLSDRGLQDSKRLAEEIQVEAGWETAVETVLGEQLQALCIDDVAALKDHVGSLDSGLLNLVDAKGQVANGSDNLASKVSCKPALVSSLSMVKTADSLDHALALRANLAPGESVITPDGLWLGGSWLRVNKGENPQAGVLKRQQELQDVVIEINSLTEKDEVVSREIDEAREQRKLTEQEREQLQKSSREHGRKITELQSKISAENARTEQIRMRRERTQNEIKELRAQFEQEQELLAESRMTLQTALDAMEQDSIKREDLLAQREDSRATLEQARAAARHDRDQAYQMTMRQQSLSTQLESIKQSLERAESQKTQLALQRANLAESLAASKEPLEGLKQTLEDQLASRLKVEESLTVARTELGEVDANLRGQEQERQRVENRLQTCNTQLERARVENQGLQVQCRGIEEQLISTQFDLETVLENLPEEANENEWAEKLGVVERRIARLGPINLAAIDEYKSQSERKTYLDEQDSDLTDALETLESAIRRIDKETRTRFKETFDQINSGLQELFPRVFGGGSAGLELTGDDLLETGVAIMARPPGKRNSTIHLLSGGEKALTAIALVFSIFRLNPAPFCMLDEVDAPLDDANVGRYARMVKEMSEQVQFIYISHNKITMEMADQLMGVTMQEPGVSRLVTVDLEEAAEMAAA